jgi:hypothetical protein
MKDSLKIKVMELDMSVTFLLTIFHVFFFYIFSTHLLKEKASLDIDKWLVKGI